MPPIPIEDQKQKSLKIFFVALGVAVIFTLVIFFPNLTSFILEKPWGKDGLFWGKFVLMISSGIGIVKAISLLPKILLGRKIKKLSLWGFKAELDDNVDIEIGNDGGSDTNLERAGE